MVNKGIGGDNAAGLRNRWSDDVIRNKPDWLSIKIGINDLHTTLGQEPSAVPPELYHEAYEEIITRARKALPQCRLLLIDPFYLSVDKGPMSFRTSVLRLLPEYLRIVQGLSKKHGTLHVKTHAVFQRLLKHHEPDTLCPEPVHPNETGHMVIADAVYAALSAK